MEALLGGGRFRLEEKLGEGGMGIVYRAFDRERGHEVALKTLRELAADSLYRFKREFRALCDISHPGLVALYELLESEGVWFFTMELVRGKNLRAHVRGDDETSSGQVPATTTTTAQTFTFPGSDASVEVGGESIGPLTVDVDRLRPALYRLAESIQALHDSGHLHRDIKPSNVMVTPEGRVVLLDFGIITELAGQRIPYEDGHLVGTPAYMAPEQCEPSYEPNPASDWYAFGTMLYELLAGVRPFRGASGREILRAKALCDPPPLSPDRPSDLADLTAALLRRQPEQRPRGPEILQWLGAEPAPRGVDAPSTGGPTEHVRGREAELAVLRDAYQRVLQGEGQACLVTGPSGIGKSVLCERFVNEVAQSTGSIVLAGRCYERESVPYKALDSLVDALSSYMRRLPAERAAALLPDDILSAVRAFPVLRQIPAVADATQRVGPLPGHASEVQRRAFGALKELLGNLAAESPVLVYIDDLQWGDADSAPFIAELAQERKTRLLFLASYRSEQKDTSPLLRALLGALDNDELEEPAVRHVVLGKVPEPELRLLAHDLLGRDEGASEAVAALAREANGSPYFLHELVRHVKESGARNLGSTSLDAVILARIDKLSADARTLLECVAVAGWRVSQGVARTAARLSSGHERPLLELRAGHFVRTSGVSDQDYIEPYHDRVREALASTVAEETRRAIHLRFAEALETRDGAEEDLLFALAHHYFQAHPTDRLARVFELNHRAGLRAAETYAFDRAYLYLDQARQIAERAGIALDAEFRRQFGDACARTGRVEAAAAEYRGALEQTDRPLTRAALGLGLSKVYLAQLDTRAARAAADEALSALGRRVPEKRPWHVLASLLSLLRGRRIHKDPDRFGSAEGEERERYETEVQLYVQAAQTAYFQLDRLTMAQALFRELAPAARLGPSPELVDWHKIALIVAALTGKHDLSERLFRTAKAYADDLRDPCVSARLAEFRGHQLHLMHRPVEAERALAETVQNQGHFLENWDYLTAVADLGWITLMRGYGHEGWTWIARGLARAAVDGRHSLTAQGHTYRCYGGPLLAMTGRPSEGARHLTEFRTLIESVPDDRWRWAQYLAGQILFLVLTDQLDDRLEAAIEQHQQMRLSPKRVPGQLRHAYVAIAYARRIQLERAGAAAGREPWRQFRSALADVRAAGKNRITVECHAHVLEAALHRLTGKPDAALASLGKAEEVANATDNPWVHWQVARERTLLARERGDERSARQHAADGLAIARRQRWGSQFVAALG